VTRRPGAPVPPGELIATISHELRQPLASIRGFTEMLIGHWADFTDDDKIEMLTEVLHDAVRVGRLVDELLDASRLEPGSLALHRRSTEISLVARRVVTNLKISYPELEASIDLGTGLPPVMADPFELERVFTNILENACRHGAAGVVSITGSLALSRQAAAVEVAIADQGPGIPGEELPHVTEKFFRGAGRDANGLGLGLWISRGIVEAHGGELVATSVAGQGTTVRFSIPVDAGYGPEVAVEAADGGETWPAREEGGAAVGKSTGRQAAKTGKLAGS
jgi:signal transduction histidine kinase